MTTRHDANFALTPGSRDEPRIPSTALKALFVAALAACSAAALSGCEAQRYPTPSVEQAPPPAPPPPAPLMGAPSQPPPPPYSPCADTSCAPAGSPAPEAPPMASPRVIASTPVPNPPEPAPYPRHRHHHRYWMPGEAQPVAPHPHRRHGSGDGRWHVVGPAPSHHAKAAAAPAPSAPIVHPHHPLASKPSAAAPAPTARKAAAPPPPAEAAIGNITDNTTGAAAGADTDHYNNLQLALSNLIGSEALLTAPDRFQANQTVDVTLTLPASFAQEVHDEAAKAGMTDAASSVNIDARLSGTGYTVAPDQPQAQPLLLGQPTVFHWKVTPTAAAVGAVKADLSAELQTVGRSLPLGSIKSQSSTSSLHVSGRLVGVGLLILVLVVVAAWIVSRTGKGPVFRRKDI